MKIRRTEFDLVFPENSVEDEYYQLTDEFYQDMELMNCRYDDNMELYYTPDESRTFAIVEA